MTSLTPAPDHGAFVAAPLGRYAIGAHFVMWCSAPDLTGLILWGAPTDRDVGEIVALCNFIEHPAISRDRCTLLDGRNIERVDGDTLLGFAALARDRMPVWSPRTKRQAVLVPDGFAGILIAGALTSLSPRHALRVLPDLATAFAFLENPTAPSAHAVADAVALDARGGSTLVARLRAQLLLDLGDPAVGDCAHALGLSSRTLQRELRRLGTSFTDELRRARVALAEDLLRLSDLKVEAIASRVGLGTASRLSAVLRRELQVTPGMLRAEAQAKRMTA